MPKEKGLPTMDADDLTMNLIRQLNGTDPSPVQQVSARIYPPYLEAKYRRENAARQLRAHLSNDERARAALLRAAFADPEEDGRKTAILGLFHSRFLGLKTLLVATAYDGDVCIRQLALEGLNALGASSTTSVARILVGDSDPDVAKLAKNVLCGNPIAYYQLEGP